MADPTSASLLAKPEFWVAVSFVAFFVVVWKPLKGALLGGLDARAERIRKELDEAQRLREEAQTLLAELQRKQRDAMQEARRHGDPRDYLVLRAWSSRRGVSMPLDDPHDPHPRWIVTSRHPERLAEAVNQARISEATQAADPSVGE